MRRSRLHCLVVFVLVFAAAGAARAAALRSSVRNQRNAVMSHGGFFLNPVGTEPEQAGDLAPPQLFEIVRPNGEAVSLGRLYTSCVCTSLESDQAAFGQGETAIVRLRNVRATPQSGQTYAIYVQLTRPVRTVLRFDAFMQSSQFIPAAEGEAPTRGNIVADGVMEPAQAATETGEDGIEIIIPKADTHVPDTSEYTLRKRAEAEAEAAAEAAAQAAEMEAGAEPETAGGAVAGAAKAVAARAKAEVEAAAKLAAEAQERAKAAAEKAEAAVAEAAKAAAEAQERAKAAAMKAEEAIAASAKAAAESAGNAAKNAAKAVGNAAEPIVSTVADTVEDAVDAAKRAVRGAAGE